MQKEAYERPEIEVITFTTGDVNTISGDLYEGWNPYAPGNSAGEYEGWTP